MARILESALNFAILLFFRVRLWQEYHQVQEAISYSHPFLIQLYSERNVLV